MSGWESWTIKKAKCQSIEAFEMGCWRRLLRVPWTARSNHSILKEISPEYSLEGLMLKLELQCFGHLMQRTDSVEKTLMLGKIEGRRRRGWQRMRWFDGIIDSMDMSLSKLWKMVKDREAWYGVTKSHTRLSDWIASTHLDRKAYSSMTGALIKMGNLDTAPLGRPLCEDESRDWGDAYKVKSAKDGQKILHHPQKESALLPFWSWASSLQNWDNTFLSFNPLKSLVLCCGIPSKWINWERPNLWGSRCFFSLVQFREYFTCYCFATGQSANPPISPCFMPMSKYFHMTLLHVK